MRHILGMIALLMLVGCGNGRLERASLNQFPQGQVDSSARGATRLARQTIKRLRKENRIEFDPFAITVPNYWPEGDEPESYDVPVAVPQPERYQPDFLQQGPMLISMADVDGDGFLDLIALFGQSIYLSGCRPYVGCGPMTELIAFAPPIPTPQSLPAQEDEFAKALYSLEGTPGDYRVTARDRREARREERRLRLRR